MGRGLDDGRAVIDGFGVMPRSFCVYWRTETESVVPKQGTRETEKEGETFNEANVLWYTG